MCLLAFMTDKPLFILKYFPFKLNLHDRFVGYLRIRVVANHKVIHHILSVIKVNLKMNTHPFVGF